MSSAPGDPPPPLPAFEISLGAMPGLTISRATNERIDFSVQAGDGRALQQVRFFVDDVLQNQDATRPYTWTMDTSAFALGTRNVRVRGVRSGASIGEHSVDVQILASPLTLTFSPGPAVRKGEPVTIAAAATDGRALRQVDFFLDGTFRGGGDNVPPHQMVWTGVDGYGVPDSYGRHVLFVQATDTNGNVLTATRDLYALTQACNVLVSTSRYVVGNHDTVFAGPHTVVQGQDLPVRGVCSASRAVQQVDFYVDGVLQSADLDAPYARALPTGALAPGSHSVSIIGRLADGATSSHAIAIEIVAP